MRRALALSVRGQGRVEPNPMVGCVLVRRGCVIGEGHHRYYGGNHAEVEAMRNCTASPEGATAYVTLEPCCHYGKTGPCTEVLLEARVRRVVAAMTDPFSEVAGKGFARLQRNGVRVDVGLCGDEARRLNAPYLKMRRCGQPWVILKWAQSLDGRIATRTGDSRWISGPQSRALVHEIRGRMDAILVGIGTVLADNPLLTCRSGLLHRVACRVVADSHLRTPPDSQLVRTAGHAPVLIMTRDAAVRENSRQAARLRDRGVDVVSLPAKGGHLDLKAALLELGRRGMMNVLVEGGGELTGALLDAHLADEVMIFLAPKLIGGRTAVGAVGGQGIPSMARAIGLDGLEYQRIGEDGLYRGRLTI